METAKDGTVTLRYVGSGSAAAGVPAQPETVLAGPDPCYDDANYAFAEESDTHRWYFNRATTDSSITAMQAETAIKRGAYNITHVYNDCGQGWGNTTYGASESYLGNTTRRADMDTGTGNCNARDTYNVRDFGDLPSGILAQTCIWWYPLISEITETDMRFNTDYSWIILPASCSGRYDVEAVATHEWGHVFGQEHVSEASHGNLTMSTNINGACQQSERTLGRGDFLGLVYRY